MIKSSTLLVIFLFLYHSSFSQKNKIETELRTLQSYRESFMVNICHEDTVKLNRCKKKIPDFLSLRKKYLTKIDSLDKVVKIKNQMASKYFYYLTFTRSILYDWEDCNKEERIVGGKKITTYSRTSHCGGVQWASDCIDSHITIDKIAKWRSDLSGFTTSETFYREDIR